MNKDELIKEMQNIHKQREIALANLNQIDGILLYLNSKLKIGLESGKDPEKIDNKD